MHSAWFNKCLGKSKIDSEDYCNACCGVSRQLLFKPSPNVKFHNRHCNNLQYQFCFSQAFVESTTVHFLRKSSDWFLYGCDQKYFFTITLSTTSVIATVIYYKLNDLRIHILSNYINLHLLLNRPLCSAIIGILRKRISFITFYHNW